MSASKNNSGFKAFVDASAGAMGALLAAVLLYPLDVAKTRQQVANKRPSGGDQEPKEAAQAIKKKDSNMWMLLLAIYQQDGLAGWFAGLDSKALHTMLSNFAYFYWYSFLQQSYEKKLNGGKRISTGANLVVASIAGALNMVMTLPLEMITTRAQVADPEPQAEEVSNDEEGDKDTQKKQKKPAHKSMWTIATEIYAEDGLVSFWKGFLPSLVLVSNPSINYTIFDRLKLRYTRGNAAKKGLTALEAFVLAAIAKAIATVLTYPMIRAKVLMQVQKKNQVKAITTTSSKDDQKLAESSPCARSPTMTQVLVDMAQSEGVGGLFKGCSAQLFNTVLKSALLVMTKEQIAAYTMRVLYALRRERVEPPRALK